MVCYLGQGGKTIDTEEIYPTIYAAIKSAKRLLHIPLPDQTGFLGQFLRTKDALLKKDKTLETDIVGIARNLCVENLCRLLNRMPNPNAPADAYREAAITMGWRPKRFEEVYYNTLKANVIESLAI